MLTIVYKEISASLHSLLAYLSASVFLLLTGLVLWIYPDTSVLEFGYASMQTFFDTAPWVLLLLVPALSMRMFAEERSTGTLELLLTRPLGDWQIILGKYISVCLLIVFALIPTLVYVSSVSALADPPASLDFGSIAGSYLGLFLLGAAFASVSIFASAIAKNQVVAFLLAVVIAYFFFSGFDSLSRLPLLAASDRFASLGFQAHYLSISRGVLDSRDLLYFGSVSIFFLAVTKTSLESRKW